MAWTIVIAGTYREARAHAEELARSTARHSITIHSSGPTIFLTDDITGDRGSIDIVAAIDAHRALEGARPDCIVIVGDYLRWNLPPLGITHLWDMIHRVRAMLVWK